MKASAVTLLVLGAVLLVACQGGTVSVAPSVTPSAEPSSASPEPTPTGTETPASEPPDGPALTVASAEPIGDFVVDPDGMTLYIFLNDMPGMSHCIGDCAANWPPFLAEDGELPAAGDGISGTLGTVDRGGGELQVTLDGWPLYFYAGDSAPGDTNGEGVGEVWYVARPDGSLPGASSSEDPDSYY